MAAKTPVRCLPEVEENFHLLDQLEEPVKPIPASEVNSKRPIPLRKRKLGGLKLLRSMLLPPEQKKNQRPED